MYKLNIKNGSMLLVTLFLAVAILYFGNSSEAEGPKQFDLVNCTLQVDKIEYFLSPTYNDLPDIIQFEVTLVNKAGEKVPFKPSGEIVFKGESGKEYLFPNNENGELPVPYNLKRAEGLRVLVNEAAKRGLAKEYHILPPGKYHWSFGTQIDRDDKIVAIIYKNGDITKTIALDDIDPIVYPRRTVPLNEIN